VARVPVRSFVKVEPRSEAWRDAATLAPVPGSQVAQAVGAAQLVARAGDAAALARFVPHGAVLEWPTARGREGDWYVQPPGASPLAGALAGIAWDSLPPATWVADLAPESSAVAVLSARLARRGASRPVVVLAEREGRRRAAIAAGGLYRWAFRGGASAEAYRALVAGLTDWLLAGGTGSGERFLPVTTVTANGLPLQWRWTAAGEPRDVVLSLSTAPGQQQDTLRV